MRATRLGLFSGAALSRLKFARHLRMPLPCSFIARGAFEYYSAVHKNTIFKKFPLSRASQLNAQALLGWLSAVSNSIRANWTC